MTWALVLWHCRFFFEADCEVDILMPKAEWGVKRTCASCSARFYDLKRSPIVCPKCGERLDIAVSPKPKRVKPVAPRKTAAKVVAKKTDDLIDDEDVDVDVDDDSASDVVVLDTDDDDGDVIVAKGAKGAKGADDDDDDDDDVVVDDQVLLDDTDDDGDADEDEDLGDAKTAKTGGGKPKDD